jgi:hypothetical protein
MRNAIFPRLAAAGLLATLGSGTAWTAPDCTDPKHADQPACTGGGGGGDGDIATNDITAQWAGAVNYEGPDPVRECTLESAPQPNGTHTAYTCEQGEYKTISVSLTGGEVLDSKGGTPSQEDLDTCTTGFGFTAYPNRQYVVGVGGGEVCTDADGCPLVVHSVVSNQKPATGYDFVKLVGRGRVSQSTNLNPFACPAQGLPEPLTTQIETVEVRVKNGKGSKADLICLFGDLVPTTSLEVTPICP